MYWMICVLEIDRVAQNGGYKFIRIYKLFVLVVA